MILFGYLKLNTRIFYLLVPILCLAMHSCIKKEVSNPKIQDSLRAFIDQYVDYSADSIDITKRDSISRIILSLPNSKTNRELTKDFIFKTKCEKEVADYFLKCSLEDKDSLGVGNAYFYIGDYYLRKQMHDSAYSYFLQAENAFDLTKDSINLSKTLLQKAVVLSKNGVFSEAEKQVLHSLNYNTSETPIYHKQMQFMIIGDVFSGLGMLDDATYFYSQALDMLNYDELKSVSSPGINNLKIVYLTSSLGNIYIEQEKYDQADALFNKIIEKYIDRKNLNSERYYAYVAISLANLKMKQHDLPKVYSLLEEAINIGKKNKNRIIIHSAQLSLVEYYYLNGQKELAGPLLDTINTEVKEVGDFKSQLKALELYIAYAGGDSSKYFEDYIEIGKLFKGETNLVKNNFIRIKAETAKLLKLNRQLSDKNKLLTVIGACLFVIICSILVIYLYRSKMKEVRLIKMFQRDTEQYYNSVINTQNYLNLVKDRERSSMAKELNDGVLNRLFATRFSLIQLGEKEIESKKSILIDEILEVERYIRDISHTIVNEQAIEIQGFEQLIRELVLVYSKESTIKFKVEIDPLLDIESLSHQKKINIYRSIQEMLQNVLIHSKCNICTIYFGYKTPALLELKIVDNGKGFDSRVTKKGTGLLNIKERIELINGKVFIISKIGGGTTFLFVIPIS